MDWMVLGEFQFRTEIPITCEFLFFLLFCIAAYGLSCIAQKDEVEAKKQDSGGIDMFIGTG